MKVDCPVLSATAPGGLRVETAAGNPASLAVIDSAGHILASGPELAEQVWTLALDAYEAFLRAEGAVRMYVPPHDPSHNETHREAER
ncbi:hypothetical protein BH160DRAFT_0392 [Burkholderia sp. H160]|nr:hypothetical protein BH160DRAFT_0392 [Burkholderia sp. H160]